MSIEVFRISNNGVLKMRILVLVPGNPPKRVLVKLHTLKLVREVKSLIEEGRHTDAIEVAMQKGAVERNIKISKMENLGTDLILGSDSAHWDAVREK